MVRCHIALGGNLGPVVEAFERALARLAEQPRIAVVRRSAIYRTRAVGDAAEGAFRNAAAELETDLPPLELLDALQAVEREFGRTRGTRWGDRPLDLDLIFYGDALLDEPRLTVPHPACWYRRFVLDPLCEIAPEAAHPEKGATVTELRDRLLERPLVMCWAGSGSRDRQRMSQALERDHPDVRFGEWKPGRMGCAPQELPKPAPESVGAAHSSGLPTFIAWLGAVAADADRRDEASSFDALPRLPRLDLSGEPDPERAARHVLGAALDEPTVERP
ncbi:MAG: 2-amino-4-hydroxy-6-hydroxymethyldihydropteridine diphosphokinase [Planctomycetales bacterium]